MNRENTDGVGLGTSFLETRHQSGMEYGENQSTPDPISRLGNSRIRRCPPAGGLLRRVGAGSILGRAAGVIAPAIKARRRGGQGAIKHPVSEESACLGKPAEWGGREGGFTSERHPICTPAISAVSSFRQRMSNLSRWSSLIDARAHAPVKSHEGLSGRGALWGKAPGFQGEVPALQELRNVPFSAGPGPPSPPKLRHMSHFR